MLVHVFSPEKCVNLVLNQLTIVGEKIDEKQHLVSDLQMKYQVITIFLASAKLEDALEAAKKLTYQRQSMLMKLHSCFVRAQDYAERLKSSEHELQHSMVVDVEHQKDKDGRIGNVMVVKKAVNHNWRWRYR
ncbi:hypothetical protein B296_00011005 [Ensete ventricosum]|uniref:Uncharacterized protein n=1 Tax=Ensete ventricosum TaxID=4639 RepID=A0A427B2J9_ENSVE|nr:hypothetical protein B296_00011005 [Ensete ventricosum]